MPSILSWNINMHNPSSSGDIITRTGYIINVLRELDPEILLLQEASDYFISKIAKALKLENKVSTFTAGGLCIILAKPSIKVDSFGVLDTISSVYITVNNVTIINCHLPEGIKNTDYRHDILCKFSKREGNMIIMGDMNMVDTENFHHETLKDIGLLHSKLTPTWNNSYFKNGSTIRYRLSRVFSNIAIEKYDVLVNKSGYSDHLPIVISL